MKTQLSQQPMLEFSKEQWDKVKQLSSQRAKKHKNRGTEPDFSIQARNRLHYACYGNSISVYKLFFGIPEYHFSEDSSNLNKKVII